MRLEDRKVSSFAVRLTRLRIQESSAVLNGDATQRPRVAQIERNARPLRFDYCSV